MLLGAPARATRLRFADRDRPTGFCVSPSFNWDRDLAADPMDVPPWRAAFETNYPGPRPVPVPVLMVQSASDEQALVPLADEVCRDLQANGTDVRMWRYDDESHVATVTVSSDDRARWILDRLEGRPVTNRVGFSGETPWVMPTCAREVVAPEEPPPAAGPVAGAPAYTG